MVLCAQAAPAPRRSAAPPPLDTLEAPEVAAAPRSLVPVGLLACAMRSIADMHCLTSLEVTWAAGATGLEGAWHPSNTTCNVPLTHASSASLRASTQVKHTVGVAGGG
jgi:hypothetical protein